MEFHEAQRQLPVSIEAEQSVLGSILIDPDSLNQVADILTAESFSTEDHREIWLAIKELYLHDKNIDVVTLIDMLVKRGVYKNDEQGRTYIKVLAEIVPTSANIKDYAAIVRDKSLLRQLIGACEEISENAYTAQGDVGTILEQAEQQIFQIVQGNGNKNFVHIKDVLVSVYDYLRKLNIDPESMKGIPTGFTDLDKVLIGFGDSDLVLVGARPGMGKTSFALNIAASAARTTKKAVAVFSLEMSCEQLVQRMLSSEALIDTYVMRNGNLSGEDWKNLAHAASLLSECDIWIDDTTGITVTGMKAKLKVLCALTHKAKFLLLDEPTAGLDVMARESILNLFREYMEEDGERTILISSHISSDLEGLCDDIYMIHEGRIIFHEDTDVLLNQYGLLKVDEKQFEELDKRYLLKKRKEHYGYACLTKEKQYYIENYPDIVVEKGTVDELIAMMIGGNEL